MHLSACKKEVVPPAAEAPSFTYTVRYEDDIEKFPDGPAFTLILQNTTPDTAGATFTWKVPEGILQADGSYRFQGEASQVTVTLTIWKVFDSGEVATNSSQQTITFQIPPPNPPDFTYKVSTIFPEYGGQIKRYALWLEATNCHVPNIISTWSSPDCSTCSVPLCSTCPTPPDYCIFRGSVQPGSYTITLTQTRGGVSLSTTKTITVLEDNSPNPNKGVEFMAGELIQIPQTRPDGTPWAVDGSILGRTRISLPYHWSDYINVANLPSKTTMSRSKFLYGGHGYGIYEIDRYPEKEHEVSLDFFDNNSSTSYATGLKFIPEEHRFAGTDSGYVDLQNAQIHIKLWMKFID